MNHLPIVLSAQAFEVPEGFNFRQDANGQRIWSRLLLQKGKKQSAQLEGDKWQAACPLLSHSLLPAPPDLPLGPIRGALRRSLITTTLDKEDSASLVLCIASTKFTLNPNPKP